MHSTGLGAGVGQPLPAALPGGEDESMAYEMESAAENGGWSGLHSAESRLQAGEDLGAGAEVFVGELGQGLLDRALDTVHV